jgi:hypothetical protein
MHSAWRNRAYPLAALLGLLSLTIGCGKSIQGNSTKGGRVELTVSRDSGYDPVWSPDGTRIAFVHTDYKREGDWGLFLNNDPDTPTPRDAIIIWDLADNTIRELRPGACRGRFLFALAWLDDDWLACAGTDPTGVDPDSKAWRGFWDSTFAYRAAPWPKMVFAVNTKSGETRTLMSGLHVIHIEDLAAVQERAVVWYLVKEGSDEFRYYGAVLNAAGEVSRKLQLPQADWRGPALAASSGKRLIAVRKTEKSKTCLSAVSEGTFEDVYRPGKLILGVYGSPDRQHVTFYEEKEGVAPGACARVFQSEWSFDRGVHAVAEDAYPGSTLTWAPDGRRIAYVRCDDGHIVIAEVPSLP